MNRISLLLVCLLVLAAMCDGGCRRPKGNAVVGSTSIQPFAEMLSQEFNKRHPDMTIEVQGGGSTAGLQAVSNNMAEIGMCSRGLKKDEEAQYKPIQIAIDGLAVVIHPGNKIDNLSIQQIKNIFSGKIVNWRELGGSDRPIHVITREEGSGTREAFQKLVMGKDRISRKAVTQESNGAVKELVRADQAAIGFMSLGLVGAELKSLKVDGVPATHDMVRAHKYPLIRPFLFVAKSEAAISPPAQAFIDFVLSPAGQGMLEKEGLIGAPKINEHSSEQKATP